jgi:hypothetical protein
MIQGALLAGSVPTNIWPVALRTPLAGGEWSQKLASADLRCTDLERQASIKVQKPSHIRELAGLAPR